MSQHFPLHPHSLLPYRFEAATPDDEAEVWALVHEAALHMVAAGRQQWDEHYPPRSAIAEDLKREQGYVIRSEGRVLAYAAITFAGEPAYEALNGKWKCKAPYATLHRMAVDRAVRRQGWGRLLLIEAERLCRQKKVESMRIDTNFDNVEMLALIGQTGFLRVGLCHYWRGNERTERIAFEKNIYTP